MRKSFTTTIDKELQKKFKLTCVKNEVAMNDVLEELMQRYIKGELAVKSKEAKK